MADVDQHVANCDVAAAAVVMVHEPKLGQTANTKVAANGEHEGHCNTTRRLRFSTFKSWHIYVLIGAIAAALILSLAVGLGVYLTRSGRQKQGTRKRSSPGPHEPFSSQNRRPFTPPRQNRNSAMDGKSTSPVFPAAPSPQWPRHNPANVASKLNPVPPRQDNNGAGSHFCSLQGFCNEVADKSQCGDLQPFSTLGACCADLGGMCASESSVFGNRCAAEGAPDCVYCGSFGDPTSTFHVRCFAMSPSNQNVSSICQDTGAYYSTLAECCENTSCEGAADVAAFNSVCASLGYSCELLNSNSGSSSAGMESDSNSGNGYDQATESAALQQMEFSANMSAKANRIGIDG